MSGSSGPREDARPGGGKGARKDARPGAPAVEGPDARPRQLPRTGPRRRWITRSEPETQRLGAELASEIRPDGVLLLSGDLGSGKTVLARGVAEALGIDPRQVLSPTFNLIREHQGAGGRLVHVDLYRLEPEEAAGIGLDEVLAAPGVKVVEWAERLSPASPPPALALRLRRLAEQGEEAREIVEIEPEEIRQ